MCVCRNRSARRGGRKNRKRGKKDVWFSWSSRQNAPATHCVPIPRSFSRFSRLQSGGPGASASAPLAWAHPAGCQLRLSCPVNVQEKALSSETCLIQQPTDCYSVFLFCFVFSYSFYYFYPLAPPLCIECLYMHMSSCSPPECTAKWFIRKRFSNYQGRKLTPLRANIWCVRLQ